MSKKNIPTRSDPGGDGNPSRRPSHQTSLRRTPRFHPQKNDDPNYEKNPEKKPQLQSPLISPDSKRTPKKPSRSLKTQQVPAAGTADASQSRRRSPRLASNSAEVTKKDADCSQSRRRSPRFGTNLAEVTKEDNLDVERRWSVSVGVDGSEDEGGDGEKGRGEKKRRKREENVEVAMETGRSEVEECCGFGGWTREQEAALRRAYFSARPSPHFWKKVSKMVFF